MTTIISRLYEDDAKANEVIDALRAEGFPDNTLDMVGSGPDAESRIESTRVSEETASLYAPRVEGGNALVVVRAPIAPFGAARRAMAIVDDHSPIDAGVDDENVYVREKPRMDYYKNVMEDHPLFLTRRLDKGGPKPTLVSEALGFPTLSDTSNRTNSVIEGGRHIIPMETLITKERSSSVIEGGKHIIPGDQLIRKERSLSVRKGGGFPFSEIFGLPLLLDRPR